GQAGGGGISGGSAAAGRSRSRHPGRHLPHLGRHGLGARVDRRMTKAGTVAWFAQHETRLAWRDWAWLLSGGRRRRGYTVMLGLAVFVVFMHGFAYLTLAPSADFTAPPDKRLLVSIGGTLLL